MENNQMAILEARIREEMTTRYNIVTKMVEYSLDEGETFQSITDRVERNVLRTLKTDGFKVGIETVRNILNSNYSVSYDPFVEYFESLEIWDEEVDYISELCKLVKVKNDEYFVDWMRKWLVGIIANLLSEKVNQQVLVFSGGQGIGKTTFMNMLVPKVLKNYANSGYLNPDSKDALVQASECMIVIMDELSSLNKNSLESFKQLVTQQKMRLRKAYGRNPENLKRRASFCGSTNDEQFLFDYSGNRRFLSFLVEDIDLDALSKLNIDLIYSQAYALFKDGFRYWFDKMENMQIEENNDRFVVRTDIDEAIIQTFEPASREEESAYLTLTATNVMLTLAGFGLIPNTSRSAQLVGKSLVKLGFEKYKSNGSMLYTLKMKM
ncbi:MAG: hypothetical protein GQ574_08445 [Crocinitomix sp.]|nr:hypothetical protein [Crocinitomix sp.]